MKILVDGRAFVKTAAGISTFLRCSIVEWAKQRPRDVFYIYLPKNLDPSLELGAVPKNIQLLKYGNVFTRKIPNLFLLLLYIPLLCKKLNVNLYYSPVPCIPFFVPKKVKTLIVVHDVVNLEQSETMELKNKIANSLFFSRSIRKADFIWTNSFYTKERVEHYFPVRRRSNIFTGCSVDRTVYCNLNLSELERRSIRDKYGIAGKFILFVGSLEPRKNLSFLLEIVPELYRSLKIQLVVVGGMGWKNSEIKDFIMNPMFPQQSTIFCGYVTNADLAKLYNAADCFVSASLGEGFGMPQLEALLCGCPVITAHNTAMIEVANGKTGAYTIKGYDSRQWIDLISRVVCDKNVTNVNELAEYDWPIIIQRMLDYWRL